MADPLNARVAARHGLARPRRGWMIAFLVAILVLIGTTAYALTAYDSAKWMPSAGASPVATSFRQAITEGQVRPDAGAHQIDYARVDARLHRLMERPEMAGLGVAIIENGRITFVKGYGLTGANDSDPVTANTVFRWASLSKGVAATLVAQLADKKLLSLDDPVARWSSTLKLPGGSEQKVTISDLLSHRLGIVKNAYDDKLEEGIDPRLIRQELAKLEPYCAPGLCHAYQNVAFDAASEVVEKATHERYGDAVRERLFIPLGMKSASTTRQGLEGAESWARPHHGEQVLPVKDAYYRVPAAGGVNSSIFDLALWMRAQMGDAPQVLPARILDTIHAPRVATDRRSSGSSRDFHDQRYGLGWRDSVYAGHRIISHRGAVSGYRSLIMFDPAAKTGVAMLWNSESGKPAGLAPEILDMLYKRPVTDWLALDAAADRRRRG